MKESNYHKVVMDVCIEEYPVTEEAGADIIKCLESDMCPLCSETATATGFKVPEENEMVDWQCEMCKTKFTVESWITK